MCGVAITYDICDVERGKDEGKSGARVGSFRTENIDQSLQLCISNVPPVEPDKREPSSAGQRSTRDWAGTHEAAM